MTAIALDYHPPRHRLAAGLAAIALLFWLILAMRIGLGPGLTTPTNPGTGGTASTGGAPATGGGS